MAAARYDFTGSTTEELAAMLPALDADPRLRGKAAAFRAEIAARGNAWHPTENRVNY